VLVITGALLVLIDAVLGILESLLFGTEKT